MNCQTEQSYLCMTFLVFMFQYIDAPLLIHLLHTSHFVGNEQTNGRQSYEFPGLFSKSFLLVFS